MDTLFFFCTFCKITIYWKDLTDKFTVLYKRKMIPFVAERKCSVVRLAHNKDK